MRKALKFFHTLSSCGLIGALLAYMIILTMAPQETPAAYADMRQTITALCDYLLIPSLAVALVSGLLSIAAHRPFQDMRWVWVKALLGLSMFEATLAIVQSKAGHAAKLATEIAAGDDKAAALAAAITYEWTSLWTIMALSIANIVLGIWRPSLKKRRRAVTVETSAPSP